MHRVHLAGWRVGLQKVSMTKTLRAQLGYELAAAKRCTDRVLEGETIILKIIDAQEAEHLAQALDALGVNVTFEREG